MTFRRESDSLRKFKIFFCNFAIRHKKKQFVRLQMNSQLSCKLHRRNIVRFSVQTPANTRKNRNKTVFQNSFQAQIVNFVNFAGCSKINSVYNAFSTRPNPVSDYGSYALSCKACHNVVCNFKGGGFYKLHCLRRSNPASVATRPFN